MNKLIITLFCLFTLLGCKEDTPQSTSTTSNTGEGSSQYNHNRGVGKSNVDIIKSTTYTTLIIEIQYFPGHSPATSTINNLRLFVEEIVDKPAGVVVLTKEIPSPGDNTYSLSQIKELESNNRDYYTSNDTMSVYFLFVDAEYDGNQGSSKVLGIAHRNTSMVLFESTIKDLSGGIGKPSTEVLETTVINHEFGHILGLVNNNLAMVLNHEDASHSHHCDNEDCLMYWLAETGDFGSNLIGATSAPGLDANCMNDLISIQ
jgi:hypothetical protein